MLWSETGRTINILVVLLKNLRGALEKDEVPTNTKRIQYMKCIQVDTVLPILLDMLAKFCMETLGVSANPTQIETTKAVRSCTV